MKKLYDALTIKIVKYEPTDIIMTSTEEVSGDIYDPQNKWWLEN